MTSESDVSIRPIEPRDDAAMAAIIRGSPANRIGVPMVSAAAAFCARSLVAM